MTSADPASASTGSGPGPYVLTDHRDDGVVLVRLNRPPLNVLSYALLGALADVAVALGADPAVKAVVVTGSEKALAAGADIDEFGGPEDARRIGAQFRAAFDGLAAIPRPVIAAIRGFALGGGLELALACDLRVAADSARVGQPEILLGIIPGAGATQRLPRLVGAARAKELIWSGRQLRADAALAIGLVDKVVPADEVESVALEWAASFASGAVAAMGLAKRAIDHGLDGPLAAGLDHEAQAFADSFATEDAVVGVRSFREHGPGKATFSGR
jgi:enoyl-CoA hydratase/carnithine racemase